MSVAGDQALGFKPGEELTRGVSVEARSPAAHHGTAVGPPGILTLLSTDPKEGPPTTWTSAPRSA